MGWGRGGGAPRPERAKRAPAVDLHREQEAGGRWLLAVDSASAVSGGRLSDHRAVIGCPSARRHRARNTVLRS